MTKSVAILLFSFQMALLVHAQEVNVNIIRGFTEGNATFIEPYLNEQIELIDPLNEGLFSKEFTTKKLTDFFGQSNPNMFTIKHKGSSPGGLSYCIGILGSENGNYRVYLLFDDLKGTKISEIRIEEDE